MFFVFQVEVGMAAGGNGLKAEENDAYVEELIVSASLADGTATSSFRVADD